MTSLKLPAGVTTEVEDLARSYVLLSDEQMRELHTLGSPAHERLMSQRIRIRLRLSDLGFRVDHDGSRYILAPCNDMQVA